MGGTLQNSIEQQRQIKEYLATGHAEVLPIGWPGDVITAARNANRAMRDALIAEVARRSKGLPMPGIPVLDFHAFTRDKVAPMVNGLFPAAERANVLEMLEKSVVFLTSDTVEETLRRTSWPHTAWSLANLYLASVGAELLSKNAVPLLGLSEETTCYVSPEYFHQENRFADFIVHEAAHVFHNCRRSTVGLPETRTKEHLLKIDFCQRETFAYACEVYSRILELAADKKARMKLAAEVREEFIPPDDKVDIDKFHAALDAAVRSRNGWSKILSICAPPKPLRRVLNC